MPISGTGEELLRKESKGLDIEWPTLGRRQPWSGCDIAVLQQSQRALSPPAWTLPSPIALGPEPCRAGDTIPRLTYQHVSWKRGLHKLDPQTSTFVWDDWKRHWCVLSQDWALRLFPPEIYFGESAPVSNAAAAEATFRNGCPRICFKPKVVQTLATSMASVFGKAKRRGCCNSMLLSLTSTWNMSSPRRLGEIHVLLFILSSIFAASSSR